MGNLAIVGFRPALRRRPLALAAARTAHLGFGQKQSAAIDKDCSIPHFASLILEPDRRNVAIIRPNHSQVLVVMKVVMAIHLNRFGDAGADEINGATAAVEIDPTDGRVSLAGRSLEVEPASELPLNRRYWLR